MLRTLATVLALSASPLLAADLTGPIGKIKALGKEGKGNAEAIAAVREIEKAEASDLPTLLAAMDDASPLALNWLRGAYETIAARPGAKLPSEALLAFLNDRSHLPQARRLAYDTLKSVDPGIEERLIPTMLDDPSGELRRDAVAYTMKKAEKLAADGNKDEAGKQYAAALSGAVDEDQVKKLAELLKGYGQSVNLVEHYGFLTKWKVIGPFDNKKMMGFDVANPPETELVFDKTYEGMAGEDGKPLQAQWKELASEDEMGCSISTNCLPSTRGRPRTPRPSSMPEWLRPSSFDWHVECLEAVAERRATVRSRGVPPRNVPGPVCGPRQAEARKNTILLKILQNEQTEDWAQDWSIQFRVCDFSGRAIRPSKPVAGK